MAVIYFIAQLLGAFMGYGLLIVVTPADIFRPLGIDVPELCMTLPYKDVTPIQAVAIEYLSTSVLILICGGVWDPRNEKYQDSIPLKFGFAIMAIGIGKSTFKLLVSRSFLLMSFYFYAIFSFTLRGLVERICSCWTIHRRQLVFD